jgi:hypothetical protein
MITQEILKQYVTYHPDTGWFTSNGAKYSNREVGSRVGTCHSTKGYRYLVVKGKTYREQRLAFLYMTGSWPEHQVDHINRVKDDNRWENLRDVPPSVNCQNRKLFTSNTSGHTGVCWNKKMQKWQVNCRANGKVYYGGCFVDKEEAIETAKRIYNEIR